MGRACGAASDCASLSCQQQRCATPTCTDGARNGAEADVDCGGACALCTGGKTCTQDAQCASAKCSGGACAAGDCRDGARNGTETDVDCGGACPSCAALAACLVATDCTSKVCQNSQCRAAGCGDGVKNGDETAVDCGGSCPACAAGLACSTWRDCTTRACVNGTCGQGTCSDSVQNGAETDVDCGGPCPACAATRACATASDCRDGVCLANVCAAPSCFDVVKNGTESGRDCGGTCAPCATGVTCLVAGDCQSKSCVGGVCAAPACPDGVKNGTETDVDCGGTGCATCVPGKACVTAGDCDSHACKQGLCQPATCFDGLKNGAEGDVDCGGGCAGCADGKACTLGSQCLSQVCTAGACAAPTCTDGKANGAEADVDCGGSCPLACAAASRCLQGSDCTSTVCVSGRCTAPSCADRVRNGTESDVDCGGSCAGCANGRACAAGADCVSGACFSTRCAFPLGGSFSQTSWVTHPADPDLGRATHPDNAVGWSRFETGSSLIDTSSGLSLRTQPVTVSDTDAAEFLAGSLTGVDVFGSGSGASMMLTGSADLGSGADGALVVDGVTAANSTDGVAHPQIVWPPTALSATVSAATGGALAAGAHAWVVTALTRAGESPGGPTASLTTSAGQVVKVTWPQVLCATGYRVYRDGLRVAEVGAVVQWTDVGTATPGAALPVDNTTASPLVPNRPLETTQVMVQNCAELTAPPYAPMDAPGWLTATSVAGAGAVPAGAYYYSVRPVDAANIEVRAAPEAGVAVVQPGTGVQITWAAVRFAHHYRVYRRASTGTYQAPSLVCDTITTTCVDGAATPAAAGPCTDCNASAGGRLLIKSRGAITVDATSRISATGMGYPPIGYAQGLSYRGNPSTLNAPNFGGGGSGSANGSGGGGYGAAGEANAPGQGGLTYGTSDVAWAHLGSAGGQSTIAPYWYSGPGGAGGGAIVLTASAMVLDGPLVANGNPGGNSNVPGGGGSGGSIRLSGATVRVGPMGSLNAVGAPGGTVGYNPGHPAGGGGRIAVYTSSGVADLVGAVNVGSVPFTGSVYQATLGTPLSTGTFTGVAHDLGGTMIEIGPVRFTGFAPTSTTLKIQVSSSADGLSFGPWLGPDCTAATAYETSGQLLCASHLGHRYLRWQVTMTRQAGLASPVLSAVAIDVGIRGGPSVLQSSAYDTADNSTLLGRLAFTSLVPAGTTAALQLRTAPDLGGVPGTWTAFLGPTGTTAADSWYTDPTGQVPLNPLHADGAGDRWVQYRVRLTATALETPRLSAVQISFARSHGVDLLIDGAGQDAWGTATDGLGGGSTKTGTRGATATFTLTVRNTGTLNDSVQLAVVSPAGFTVLLDGAAAPVSVGPLAPGATAQRQLTVAIPASAGSSARVVVTATSLADSTKVDSVAAQLAIP